MGSMRVQSSLTITQGVGHGVYEGAKLPYHYTGSRTWGSMRVQSSLTVTQGVGQGFYEGAELSYHYTGSRTQVL